MKGFGFVNKVKAFFGIAPSTPTVANTSVTPAPVAPWAAAPPTPFKVAFGWHGSHADATKRKARRKMQAESRKLNRMAA